MLHLPILHTPTLHISSSHFLTLHLPTSRLQMSHLQKLHLSTIHTTTLHLPRLPRPYLPNVTSPFPPSHAHRPFWKRPTLAHEAKMPAAASTVSTTGISYRTNTRHYSFISVPLSIYNTPINTPISTSSILFESRHYSYYTTIVFRVRSPSPETLPKPTGRPTRHM